MRRVIDLLIIFVIIIGFWGVFQPKEVLSYWNQTVDIIQAIGRAFQFG